MTTPSKDPRNKPRTTGSRPPPQGRSEDLAGSRPEPPSRRDRPAPECEQQTPTGAEEAERQQDA
jgi:hypothetical protein